MNKTIRTIEDLSGNGFDLIQAGYGNDVELNSEFGTDYDGFLVKIKDGEYVKVYGFYGLIPLLTARVHKVK